MWDRTLEFLIQGGPVMVPLFGVAALAFGLLYERWRFFRAAGSPEAERWLAVVQAEPGDGEDRTLRAEPSSPAADPRAARLIADFLRASVLAPEWAQADRAATLRRQEIEFRERLERGLALLGMLASLAPLLGLLGTVTGMIASFQTMAAAGVADSRGLSLGIAEALITTEVGLSIALPTLVARRYFVARAERFRQTLHQLAVAAAGAQGAGELAANQPADSTAAEGATDA